MPTLTALRRAGPHRVALDVDGRPWRTVSDEIVVRCRLHVGLELDRPLLRRIRAELRRTDALATAGHALAHRPLSRAALQRRLRERGVAPTAEREALAVLEAAGLVDDPRSARSRAAALAERGWGNAAIEARLAQEGFGPGDSRAALEELPGEAERAGRLIASAPDARKAWALLMRRGFSADAAEAALAPLDADGASGLG